MKVAFCTRIASLVLVATLAARGASAQTLTLPNGPVYEAGPDYASDVLQDPWDFTNADDIAPDPGQVLNWTAPDPTTVRSVGTSVFLSNGWFRGVPGSDAHIGLLYRADALAINTGRSGARFPIQTDRYRKLAVKMRVTGSPNPTQLAAFWFHASILENNWPTRGGSAFLAPVISGEAAHG